VILLANKKVNKKLNKFSPSQPTLLRQNSRSVIPPQICPKRVENQQAINNEKRK